MTPRGRRFRAWILAGVCAWVVSLGLGVLAWALDSASLLRAAQVMIISSAIATILGAIRIRRKTPRGKAYDFTDGIAGYPLEDLGDFKHIA